MRSGRRSTNVIFALLAAAGLCLSSAGCVAPAGAPPGASVVLPADTLALVEGRRLLDEKQYDLARERLMESALSGDDDIRVESFMYLNVLEMKLENYDSALVWLGRYHAEAMRLFRQALDAEERIDVHREEVVQSISGLRRLVVGIVFALAAGVAAMLFFMHRQRDRRAASVAEGSSVPPDLSEWERHTWNGPGYSRRRPCTPG